MNRRSAIFLIGIVAAAALSVPSFACETGDAPQAATQIAALQASTANAPQTAAPQITAKMSVKSAALLARLKKLYPGPDFKYVRESPIPGLYEVTVGPNIGYMDETGRYMLHGELLDLQEKQNLTEPAVEALQAVDVSTLPLSDSVKLVSGDGSRKLYAFVDPECPFCKQFDSAVSKLSNYTLYLFLFPLTGLHPDAMRKSTAIWCANDRAQAWISVVRDGKKIETAACDNPIARNQALAEKLAVDATPIVFLPSGKRYQGGLEPGEIETALAR